MIIIWDLATGLPQWRLSGPPGLVLQAVRGGVSPPRRRMPQTGLPLA
jgi:hypothetical protein